MLPTMRQQLQAMQRRMDETVVPALPADAKFAREQAAFIVTTLKWILDTHEQQYRYEVIENLEFRRTLRDMVLAADHALDQPRLFDEIRAALAESGPSAADAAIPVATIIDQNRRLKQLAATLYAEVSERVGARDNPTRKAFARAALRQGEREIAYYRMTGFVALGNDLATVLAEQSRDAIES